MSSGEFYERIERQPDGTVVKRTIEAKKFAVQCANVGNGCKSRGRAYCLASTEENAHRLFRRDGWRISPSGTKATCGPCMDTYGGPKR